MAGGAARPLVFVRIHSNSQIYVLNSSEVLPSDERELEPVESDRRLEPQGSPIDFFEPVAANLEESDGDPSGSLWSGPMKKRRPIQKTPLAIFVTERLAELGLKQSEFCRQTGFDQGLLSKIQSSMITKLNLETVLKLARGLGVSPKGILELTGRADLHELIVGAYSAEAAELIDRPAGDAPEAVVEIDRLAMRASSLERDLTPVIEMLASIVSSETQQNLTRAADGRGDLN
jgi:transcriptional regulator with XRE-family HTH domain